MMTSVDMLGSSNGAVSTPRTGSGNMAHYHQHQQPNQPQLYNHSMRSGSRHASFSTPSTYAHPHANTASHGGGPPGSEAGRVRTEQVMVECFYKITELVLQSRVHLQSETEHGRGHRRARFNLDIEEIQYIRDAMAAWKEDVHLPLTIDIYWEGGDASQAVLLERWSVTYAPDMGDMLDYHGRRHSSPMNIGSGQGDVMQQLKDVVKKISVLLRAIHSLMRQLPAHRFFRQSYPSSLSYEIHADGANNADPLTFEQDVATSRYSFVPINTPFGFLKVSTMYRRDCSILEERRPTETAPIFKENFIIQDYVPASPPLAPSSTTPTTIRSPSPHTPTIPKMIPPMSPRVVNDRYADDAERRRRSSPDMVNDEQTTTAIRRAKVTSQPMAIPQQVKTISIGGYDDSSEPSGGELPMKTVQHHPHSYAEPEQLRTVATNPNVTAAPYGYGNVVIERGSTPPTATALSNGGIIGSGVSGGFSGSFQDQLVSSPHPLSTPPRHPHSMMTSRTASGRLLLSTSAGKRSSHEFATRASLENFSLDAPDTTIPSPMQSARTVARGHTFHFGSPTPTTSDRQPQGDVDDVYMEAHRREQKVHDVAGTSPHMTPPFMADSPPKIGDRNAIDVPPLTSAALVLRNTTRGNLQSQERSPVFASSPPFQANPSELLSTSPGYSFSKQFHAAQQRRGPPTFLSTDLARTSSFRITATPSTTGPGSAGKTMSQSKTRTFSADLYENGIWGVSPDTPDTFGLALAGSTRRRLLSGSEIGVNDSNDSVTGRSSAAADGDDDLDTSSMLLPFAIGDVDNMSTATTVTNTSSEGGGDRLASIDSGTVDAPPSTSAWDTASVGNFLLQLKHAPRLHMFGHSTSIDEPSIAPRNAVAPLQPNAAPAPSFDDELESFRNLRDELAREL